MIKFIHTAHMLHRWFRMFVSYPTRDADVSVMGKSIGIYYCVHQMNKMIWLAYMCFHQVLIHTKWKVTIAVFIHLQYGHSLNQVRLYWRYDRGTYSSSLASMRGILTQWASNAEFYTQSNDHWNEKVMRRNRNNQSTYTPRDRVNFKHTEAWTV